uniref:Uncharacterized protein n=1 Tax=Zooxanthella nutricula TaxID=1333877 RepID=A0A6V0I0H9_9DINO|mmetsp:Transcript_104333/g.319409  ORF Transcript_104333/g.319409 Transcript_104333/m.319409 type:complete len:566 (+) Transcript_104333:47-1744(+)|eukprot:CAMPEP_0198504098 /NCGR_PEP_ID=MMETSP1462-20131121/10296_1 /TAXON_ID=1333877 /ORGANISM="Brandtodinium nutriculum, Strain RCC3387" /LENGTH=565 /DNA_ID=CAMNT_0044233247 /DNA_START=47 /DNA_END=1744 /DNA_ORIENTATION=+
MSRITVFSLSGCPHCLRAKTLLTEKGYAYTEINLSEYPEKRTDILQLCDRLTVPQIFFSAQHVGGASELAELNETGQLAILYEEKIANGDLSEVRAEKRLQKPEYEARKDPAFEDANTLLPQFMVCKAGQNGSECLALSYSSTVKLLSDNMKADKTFTFGGILGWTPFSTKVRDCFTGRQLIEVLKENPTFRLEEASANAEAEALAQNMLRAGVFYDVAARCKAEQETSSSCNSTSPVHVSANNSETFQSGGHLYKLQAHDVSETTPLNCWARFCTPSGGCLIDGTRSPMLILKKAKAKLGSLVSKHTDKSGLVDYVAVAKDEDYDAFRIMVSELQEVDYVNMQPGLKKPFSINLYNMIVIHAFAEIGIAQKDLTRLTFFNVARYQLGAHSFTLNEIENGVLRGNAPGPAHMAGAFAASDSRIKAIIPRADVDFRIHFGLNCGAKSCPPVKWFTEEASEEELRLVAQAFCEDDGNFLPDPGKGILLVSKILEWYRVDFERAEACGKKARCGELLLPYCRGQKKDALEQLLKEHPKYKITYNSYDWSTNARVSKEFTRASVWSFWR